MGRIVVAPRTTGNFRCPNRVHSLAVHSDWILIMSIATRAIVSICAAAAITATGSLAVATSAQATTTPLQSSAQASPSTTMYIYNLTDRAVEITVFARIETLHTMTLQKGELWKLPEAFGPVNEIHVKYVGDPNGQFLGHFDYSAGNFHMLDVPLNRLSYGLITGRTHGIYFNTPHA